MRVVKEADVRKNEILDAAALLFAEKGFDGTSTGDILEAVGIARGTLYHHFKSKEDIMDAIIERRCVQLLTGARQIAENTDIPVEERMLRTVMALKVTHSGGGEGQEMIEHLHRPQNALMQQKMKRIIMQQVPPMLAEILKDGITQGLFDTPYPLECMEMTVAYLNAVFDDDVLELTQEEQLGRIQAFIFQLERLLGVESGRLAFVMRMFTGRENG